MEILTFLDSFTLLTFVKFLLVTLLTVYAIFALLMMKQISAMTKAVQMQDDYIIRGLGMLHFGFSVVVLLLSLGVGI
ncbi:MAG: hypothetical protein E6R05_02415 [Candidatus Moraniibacteriota bacterium]|nr:MAG: hypothetical protein E6R05_02415 [Candidatus Moranbacteria bacterium]